MFRTKWRIKRYNNFFIVERKGVDTLFSWSYVDMRSTLDEAIRLANAYKNSREVVWMD